MNLEENSIQEDELLNEVILDEKKKRKNPPSSLTYTMGDPDLNLKHFNKYVGNDNNNPSTEEAKAQKAAEQAAKEVGTFLAQDIDGSNTVETSLGSASEAGGEASGDAAGNVGESLQRFKLPLEERLDWYINDWA